MPGNDMTATTMEVYLPEHTSELVSITYRSNVVNPPLLDHRWEPELGVGRGDTVNIRGFTQNAAGDATKRTTFGTGAAITWTANTESETLLVVNTMAYGAFRMPVEMSAQKMADYVPMLVSGAGLSLALTVDTDITGDNTNGYDSAATTVGTDNVDVTEDNILTCETNLSNQNAPAVDRFLVVSPATLASMRKIESARSSLYAGSFGNIRPGTNDYSSLSPNGNGYIGDYLLFHVYCSNNLEAGSSGKKNAAFQREAIAIAIQKDVTTLRGINLNDGIFDEWASYIVYGLKKVKGTFVNELDGK